MNTCFDINIEREGIYIFVCNEVQLAAKHDGQGIRVGFVIGSKVNNI